MEPTPVPIPESDEAVIAKAIMQQVMQYDGFPFEVNQINIRWNTLPEDYGVGIFPSKAGAYYLDRNVLGDYTAQFPFLLVLRMSPENNSDSIENQGILSGLAKMLEKSMLAFESSTMKLLSVERTTPVGCSEKTEGHEDWAVSMKLKYEN